MMRLVKIVRDNIGSALTNEKVIYREVTKDEYLEGIRKKLIEEATEYILNPCESELADVLEVAQALAKYDLGVDWPVIEEVAKKKTKDRGAFDNWIGMYVQSDGRFEATHFAMHLEAPDD